MYKTKRKSFIAAVILLILYMVFFGCKNDPVDGSNPGGGNETGDGIDLVDGVYTIVIDISGNKSGDTVIVSPAAGGEGDKITLTYSVANTANYNLLDFGGVNLPIASINKAESGTKTYSINAADASNGVITITAVFTHTIIDMARIPAGTFIMGSPVSEPNSYSDETQHSVTLSGFSMGKYQVTQAQWIAVMGNGEDRTVNTYGKGSNYPAYYVNWYDAIVFCNKLSIKEGLNPVYSISGNTDPAVWITDNGGAIPTGNNAAWNSVVMDMSKNGYRLPTEAEWEYACRGSYINKATETYTKPFGISDGKIMVNGRANFDVSYPYYEFGEEEDEDDMSGINLDMTTDVGSYAANNYGLYDMHGNVWEWCWDWYDKNYYSNSPANDPTGAVTGSNRVERGGGWATQGHKLRSAYRGAYDPYKRDNRIGFRLARSG
jgi:formylglycine-generating enzyme required for sulfatase activity